MRDDGLESLELRIEENALVPFPGTGEAVDLRDPNDVAEAIARAREMKLELDSAVRVFTDALRLEAMRLGKKTLDLADGRRIVFHGGQAYRWDGAQMLRELEDAGMPIEEIATLVREEISYRVDGRRAISAASANPRYGEIIDRCREIVPKPWSVSVR